MVNLKLVSVPAINGLGMTKGTEEFPSLVSDISEEISVDNSNVEEQQQKIYEESKRFFTDKGAMFVGGDHSISYPLTKAFFEKNPEASLVVLDAHPDLMPPMQEPAHEEWLRALVERTNIIPKNIFVVGVQKDSINVDKREIDFAKEKEINLIYSGENTSEFLKNLEGKKIYLSIDVDFFDKSVIQATGYQEENGFSEEEGLKLIKNIFSKTEVLGGDIVEINPRKAGIDKTKEVVNKILGIMKNEKS